MQTFEVIGMDSPRVLHSPASAVAARAAMALSAAAVPGAAHEIDSALLGRPDVDAVYESRFGPASVSIAHSESRAHLVLVMDGAASVRFADGRCESLARLSVIGPTAALARFESTRMLHLFGAVLQPGLWAAVRPGGVAPLVDRVVPAATLFGDAIDGLAERLAGAGSFTARTIIVCAVAATLARRSRPDPRTAEFIALIDHWLDTASRPGVERLATLTGLSRRQVEERCKRLYGVSPRLLARRHRALAAADRLAAGGAVEDVIEDGFYDQSHLIREVRHFTGMTPRRLRIEPPGPALRRSPR